MISIGQEHPNVEFFKGLLRQAFDGRGGAYRHEDWGVDHSVRGGQAPEARAAGVGLQNLKTKTHPQQCSSPRGHSRAAASNRRPAHHHQPQSNVNPKSNPQRLAHWDFLRIGGGEASGQKRSEEHTSELQSLAYLVCRLLLEKKKKQRK